MYAATMSRLAAMIGARLAGVRELRRAREADQSLGARLQAVKRFQHARFARDYAPLQADPRHRDAVIFFLDELYGPTDFAARDAEFERVAPLMARLVPDEVMRTVVDLIELHSLTEELDQEMAAALTSDELDDRSYRAAWLEVGRRADRARQLALLLAIGRALDQHTNRSRLLATTLRVMRAPARAAGFGRLQSFLESGMSAFVRMQGARAFLRLIEDNESRTIDDLFANK